MTNSTILNVGKNVAFFRNNKNLTQEELSEISGITSDYLSEIERGKKIPRIKTLVLIANALEVEAYLLLKNLD